MYKGILKLSLKAVTLGVFLGVVLFFAYEGRISQASNPRIVISEQPGSPLLILSTGVDDSSNPLEPHYWYSITNNTDKPIRSYTILEAVSSGSGSPIISSTLTDSPAIRLFLTPHGSKQESGGYGRTYRVVPDKVLLSVDFVEFADGTRWGDDTTNSGEKVDGKRAGGKAAIKKYREILITEGIEGLERALTNPSLIQPEGSLKTDDWRTGFEIGVNTVKSRLRKTRAENDGIRRELDRPFDSRDGRQEP